LFQFLLNRFREPFTWIGAFAVASAFGFELSDTQQAAITLFGMALMGSPDDKLAKLLPKKRNK
jgi:hypothetical protein